MADVRTYHSTENDVTIRIDHDLCTGCGACIEVCPQGVYELSDDDVAEARNVDDCVQCAACQGECSVDAIIEHSAW
jgi:NAD-dependent dihydropyrimidine dehydrogenase PreA subunit